MRNALFTRLFAPLLCLCVGLGGLFVVSGCSNGGKTALQGEATYGGEPIPLGTITFTPQGDGYRAIQTIKDGKFDVPAKHGVAPGVYTVTVEGYNEAPADDPDQVADKMFPDYATTFTVEAGVPIVIDVPATE